MDRLDWLGDEVFLHRLANGDVEARRVAVERFEPIIRKSVVRVLGARGSAFARAERDVEHEDLVQDVMVAILDPKYPLVAKWDAKRGTPLDGYVAVVAAHTAKAHLRRFRREARLHETWSYLQVHDTTSHRRVAAVRDLESLLAYVASWLDARGVSLFKALFVSEDPLHDICHRFQLSRNAVYAFRSRVRRHLESAAWLTMQRDARCRGNGAPV